MARPTTIPYGAGRFLIGDGADPEVFVAPCGFTQANVTIDKSTNETAVPDCDDPDAPVWSETGVTTMSWSMQLQGVMAKESYALYEAAALSSKSVSVRHELKGAGTGTGTPDKRYQGKAHIKIQLQAQRGEKYQVTLDAQGDGELTSTNILIAP